MEELKKHIYDEHDGLHYTLVGDYYILVLQLLEENCAIGGRMHKNWSYITQN